jgi:hypothetical protein
MERDLKYLTLVFEVIDQKLLDEGGNPLRHRLPGLKCIGASVGDLMEECDQMRESIRLSEQD